MLDKMTDQDKHKTVGLLSALVCIGIIDIEEFTTVMIGLEDVYIEDECVSEGFMAVLTDWYLR